MLQVPDLRFFASCQKSFIMNDNESLAAELRAVAGQLLAVAARLLGEDDEPKPPDIAVEREGAGLCIVCGEKPPVTRGCCSADYQASLRHIKKHHLTDRQAIEQGLLWPEGPRGRLSRLEKRQANQELPSARDTAKTAAKNARENTNKGAGQGGSKK